MRKRLKFALLAGPVAILAFLALSAPAMAGDELSNIAPDPQTTNVPYLAWAGNQVRIAKCFDVNVPIPEVIARAKFRIEDWSGVELAGPSAGFASIQPQFLNDADGDVVGHNVGRRLCFAVHVSSLKPGMAVIKLAARPDLLGLLPGADVLAKHQFIVIWLRSSAPVIREVANADFPDLDLGDPSGNGVFNPLGTPPAAGFRNGLVQINVKGTAPMGNDFYGIFPGNSITLPDDWESLAGKFAFDDDASAGGIPGSAKMRWDIHDDQTDREGHAGNNPCLPRDPAIDAVDNCLGGPVLGSETGAFSNIYGFTFPTVGPFDQLRPLESLLSDGKVDEGDAPMPPLRVDVHIAAGGAGALEKADKDDIYVRDQSVPDETAHNLYAPFYQALIPAALPEDFGHTSGVAGSFSNNFPGFQTDYYDYWDLLLANQEDPLRGRNVCKDELGEYRTSPTGADHVAVYTDEHGEAFVTYNPNVGFNFAVDSNFRCDLDLPANRSFISDITAVGIYPDQPVIWDQESKTSNTIRKTVNIAHSKVLACVPKGTNESFCVETIRDIAGNPVSGALVRFSRTPLGNIEPDAALHGGFDTRGQVLVDNNGPLWVDVRTNLLGQAGVVVTESLNICVDVKADNLGTQWTTQNPGVKRFFLVNPTTGGTTVCGGGSTPPPPPPGGGTGGTTTTPTTTPTPSVTLSVPQSVAASVVSLGGTPTPAVKTPVSKAKATAIKAKLVLAQLLSVNGNRYLVLKLKSTQNSAKVRISLVNKNGKVTRVVIRKVATNRAVTVPNLKFGKTITSVRVSVVA